MPITSVPRPTLSLTSNPSLTFTPSFKPSLPFPGLASSPTLILVLTRLAVQKANTLMLTVSPSNRPMWGRYPVSLPICKVSREQTQTLPPILSFTGFRIKRRWPWQMQRRHMRIEILRHICESLKISVFGPFSDPYEIRQLECAYAPNNTALENTVNAFSLATRNQIQPMSGYPDLAVYLGFAHGDEGPSVWYTPGKLGRLSALKRQWDPKGVFSFYNAVPLR